MSPEAHERSILLILAGMQFTNILDFVIMMPMSATFIQVFHIEPAQFAILLSSYSTSAAIAGVLSAFFVDRFDRKTAVLIAYGGFLIGTLLCALSQEYSQLMAARVLAGAFGGVLGALVLSMVSDAVPESRRGQAVGIIMASFSVATIAGVPAGLLLNEVLNWHVPFYFITAIGAIIWPIAFLHLPAFRGHIAPVKRSALETLKSMGSMITHGSHLRAMVLTVLLMFSGFTVIPYIAPYLTYNVGLEKKYLALVYLCGGLATIFSSRYAGRLADRHGKQKIFSIIGLFSIIPIVALTSLPPLPMAAILGVTTIFMIFVNGRFVPAMAMITTSARPKDRGSFMSVQSSVQHLFSGVSAAVGGALLTKGPEHTLIHYEWVGYFASAMTIVAIAWVWTLKSQETPR